MDELLTLHEVAKKLRISYRTAYRLVKRGELKAVKIGGQYRFPKSYIEEILTPKKEEKK